jgi:large subunit ribosomal protein L17
MRHGKRFNHLGRKAAHRKAMLSNMAASLIEHKRINTTVAKAKELRKYVEPLITRSKENTTHNRRVVFSYLQNKYAVTELFNEVAAKVGDRPGGYTRIIKTGNRLGDNAEMCMIELVDYNEIYSTEKKEKKTRRSRRGGSKPKTETAPASEPVAVAEDAPVAEEVAAEDAAAEEAVVEDATVIEDVAEEAVEEETVAETPAEEKEEKNEAATEEPTAEANEEETPEATDDKEDDKKAGE